MIRRYYLILEMKVWFLTGLIVRRVEGTKHRVTHGSDNFPHRILGRSGRVNAEISSRDGICSHQFLSRNWFLLRFIYIYIASGYPDDFSIESRAKKFHPQSLNAYPGVTEVIEIFFLRA